MKRRYESPGLFSVASSPCPPSATPTAMNGELRQCELIFESCASVRNTSKNEVQYEGNRGKVMILGIFPLSTLHSSIFGTFVFVLRGVEA